MKKLSKFGRSTLSVLLCLTMLLTTFCFFDIGSVISGAIISKGDHALTEAGTTSNTFAEYSINLPELVYIKPGGKDSQYFLNSSTDGSVSEPTSSTSVLSFACSTARSVTFSVALYDSTLSSTVSSNRITNIAFADGTYMSSDKSLSVSASSVNKTIKTVTLANAETAKEYIIRWTIVYTTASGSYTTYAYTGVKFPSLAQAGMTTRGYYYGTTGGVAGNPAEQSAYSFLTGVDSVAGGNVGSKFMSTGASLTAPLVNFNSSIYPKSLSAPVNSTYFDPDGEGVLVAYAEYNNNTYFGQGSRIFHTVWDDYTDKAYIPKDMIQNANYFGGSPSTTADNYGYAAANITIDTSRYTDFSQVPNLSAGFVEFDSDGGEDQNYLHVIRNCSYVGWDASKYFRDNRTSGLAAGSMNTQATIWCPDVDRSSETNDKVFVRGLYKLNGNIYNAKTNLTKSTSGGTSRTIASYNNGVYTTYMRFEYSLRWNPWIGSSEYSSHIAAVRLNATLVDRSSARTYYHKFLNSGVNTSASNWSTINEYLEEYAKSLCVSTSSAGTITDPTSAISTAQANLKTTMISPFASTFPVYFDVPEVIYLKPQSGTGEADFQYVLDQTVTLNSQDNTTSKTVNVGSKGISSGGNITFYYADAVNVKITQSGASSIGLSQSGTGINIKEIDTAYNCTAGTLMKASIISGKKSTYTSGYITWVATYLDSVDGHTKTITAKTYVYAPSTSVAAALGAGSYKNSMHAENHFTSTYWITGGHSVSNRTGTYADGANGKLTDTKTGGMYDPPLIDSTVTTGGNGGNTATSAYPATVPSGSGTTYARVSGDQDNKNMNVYGGTLNLEVDTSRFSTFAQIPNLRIGYDVNHIANTNSNNDRWMHYDVGNTKTVTFDATSTGRKISRSLDGSIPTENTLYTMTAYANPNYSKNSSSKIPITNYIYLNVTLHDTSELREAIEIVQKQFANLGINGGDSMYSYYYSGDIYNTFVSKYKDAYSALTKVDGYYGSYTDQIKLNNLASDLKSALNSLISADTSKNNLQINCTAREYNLGLEKLADGKYKIIEIPNAKQYSLTYNARDNVYFAPDSYTGFTYAGSYELTNTSITPSSYYGTVFSSLPKFLSASDYTSKTLSYSGTSSTIATTSNKTTTVPKFDGNATSFEWVAAVNDTSLTMVNFYYLDRNTINFDPNDGSSKVNLLNEATVRKSANNFYAPTTTVSGSNGVTVTYNQKTNIFTFNGTPTGGLTYFTLPIAGRLKADTSYTYRAVYVGGSATIPSGTSLTISLDICKADGTKCYKASGTTYSDRFCFDHTCGNATASRTLAPDAYQAANAEFLQIFTYSADYTLAPTYNNYQVKLELVESGTANSTFSPNSKEAYYGRQLGTLPTPVRDNYEFLGWFTAPDGGERVTASDIMGTEDMTVYAHWAPDNKVVLLDNDFNFDDFVAKGSTAATTLNSFANSFKACASPGYQDALTDQTKPLTSTVFNENDGETALNISYDRSSIGDSGLDYVFDTLKSTTYTASTAGEYTVSYEYRINDYYSRFYEENADDGYDSVVIGFSTDSGYWYSGGEGVSYTENKSTTEGYEMVTLTRTFSANTNYFFTMAFYFCNGDGANELRADIDIKNIVVKDPNGNIVLSSNSLACANGSASFDPDAREITLKPTGADCYTSTYDSTARYRSTLEAGKKYTLMMDYNASTNVRIRPYVFFYPSATSTSYTSTAAIVVDVPAGTGTYAMQFTVPTDNYYQIRFGIYNYQNGSTLPGSVTFGNISIQRTEIYADGAYNTDSSTYLGWVSKVTGPSSTSSAVYANDLNSRYEKITSHYQDIGYQNAYTNLRVPTREGYNFVGWFDASGTQYTDASGVGTKVCTTDGVKLYSRWTAKDFSLKYNAYKPNDSKGVATSGTVGSLPSPNPQSLKFGIASTISSTLPTLTGYTFAGWSTTSGGSAAYQKGAALSASTVSQMYQSCSGGTYNLYTAWTANKFYVKFNGNGSTSGTMSNQQFTYDVYQKLTQNAFVNSRTVTYDKNDTTEHPATLTTTSVTKSLSFKGWTASAEAVATANPTVKYTDQQEIKNPNGYATSGGTTNLYAKWQGVTVTLPTPTRTGYTFAGWYDAASGGNKVGDAGASYIITADKTLYAHWTVNSYTVTYNFKTNGGTPDDIVTSVNYGAAVDLPKKEDSKSGWEFVGWNTNKDATTALSSLTMPANNITLYAIYKKTLTANFYSGVNKATIESKPVTIWNRATSGTVTSPKTYTAVWDFVGWTTSTDKPSSSTSYIGTGVTVTITASQGTVNYYALYKALHTLVYDANGGSGAPAKSEAYGYYNSYPTQQNGQHTISSTVPTKTGYTFGGWNTNTAGTGTNYTAGQTYTNTASSNTLYAKWTVNTITLKYNGNGNTGGTIPADSTFTYGASVTTAAAPTRAYTITYNANSGTVSPTSATATYTFGGWKSSVNSKNYNASTAYTDSFGATSGSVTLTAQWSGGTVTFPEPTRTGYDFAGWYDAASGGNKIGDAGYIYTATANKTFYAHWTPKTITLKYNGNGNTGGTIPADSTFSYGSSVTTAAALTKAYTITYNANSGTVSPTSVTATYTFGGWKSSANSKNYNASTAYTDSFGATSGSVTLTAQWNGGTVTLPKPTRTGYGFAGWYDAASGGTKIGDAGKIYTATENKTLYAHWNANTITLKYNGDGNTGGTVPADSTFTYGSSVTTAAALTKAYTITYNANSGTVSPSSATATYTFGGWKSSANSKNYNASTAYTDSFGATSGTVTLTAQWSGGTVTLPTPTKTGYTFTGWYDAASGGSMIGDAGTSYTATANKTLYAHWEINSYTVTYDYKTNGGTSATKTTASVNYGAAVDLTPTATKSGWTFVGWNTNKDATTALSSLTMPANNITLYAIYKKTITANFYWINASDGKTVTETQTVIIVNAATSGTVTCSTTPASVTYNSRTFTWIGWRTDTTAAAQTKTKSTSQSVSADTNFYAVYSGTLTLSYNANKGTGAPSSQTATQYLNSTGTTGSVSYNKSIHEFTVSTTVPTYSGWTFDGWATTSTATSGKYGASPKTTKISNVSVNTTLYAIWTKTFTVNFYYYNNQVETKTLTIYNGASSGSVTSPTIADQTVGGITYTGRGWSTSNSATASVSVASGANVSVSGNANYYASYEATRKATFYYCTEPTSTIKGSGAAQSSVTVDAVRYMNYTGTVVDSNYTVPTQVTSSHGNGVAENYIGVSAAKNNSSTVTPTTANTMFYAVYSESLTFYYYNGSAHTSSSLTRYMLSNGTSYNASMSGTVPTPSAIDSKTAWSGNWSYINDSYNTGNFRSPTATGVNSLYAVYNKTVALIYNLNGGTSSAIANTTGTAHLISKNGGVNTFAVSLAITDTVPTKTDYTFLGWADTSSATAPQYYAKHTFSLSADKTIYAVWLETATPNEKVNNKDVYGTEIDIVKGVKVTGFTKNDVTVQEITTKHKLYNSSENAAYQALCEAYTNALNTYKNSPSVDNAKALTTARDNLANAVAPQYNSSDRTYIDGKFTIEYASGVTDRPVAAGEHSVSELNLNHYSTANLDSTLYQLETTVGISLANMQSKINEAVKTIAKNFVAKSLAKDTDPMYSVYENAQKAIATGLTGSGIKAINYVYTGKGNYTYYCYTNTATPTLLLTVDDVVGNGRVCYPTKSKVEKTATVSGTVNSSAYSIGTTSVDNDEYLAYLAMGMGTSMTGGASYYSQKSVIKLTPTFTSGKNGSVSYQIKASDDSYNSASTEFGGNYATTSKLSSGKTSNAISTSTPDTNVTPVNTITIVIDYHETTNEAGYRNSMYIYGDQVINDKWLKQFHILRSSGGASNWEWPKTTDTIYTVDDGTYGQSNYGSFTYTFTYTSGASNNFAAASLGTIDAATIAGLLKSTANYNSMKAKKFAGANKGGDGLGYMEWPASGGWNINYYPKNQAYTYVHIVDRWGNVDDKVIYVGNIDAIAAQFKTASVGEYTVLEDGGSGFETLSLNSTGFEILTDENSTLEDNVFRTAGNTVRISTGEANKAYTLTMTDKATNSSTATVKSDENGIITLSVEDTAYESGVYTFMLNSVEVNLYDGAETDKYVLSVSDDEVDEGETAQITVTTKGDVSKLRFTDEDGNTTTVASFVQNDDGTRTWTFAKARPAGEYTYKITVKVGYEWLDEGDTAALIFNERILDSGKVRSAEYDGETGLYKVTFEGRATKVQFVSEDGMTRTYTRYAEAVKSRKTYDADGNEVNDTARTLDHEVWYVEARLYSGQNYTVVGKFEAGWNRAEDATSTVTGK